MTSIRSLSRLVAAFVILGGATSGASAQTCSSAAPQSGTTSATSGVFRVYAYGVADASSVKFPTWGALGDQDDLVWYDGINAGGGTWYAEVDLARHKVGNPEFTTFTTHVYAYGASTVLCAYTTWTRTQPVATCTSAQPQSANTNATSGTFRIYAFGVQDTNSMLFPTWASVGGQDDLIWYPGVNAGNGLWYADIDLANHLPGAPQYGTFTTHIYAYGTYGQSLCAYTTWSRTLPTPPQVQLTNPAPGGQKQAIELGGSITLTASAWDDEGVSFVEYYANGAYLGRAVSSPYPLNFGPATPGIYEILAIAYDGGGLSAASQVGSVAFVRRVPLIEPQFVTDPLFVEHTGPVETWYLPTNQYHFEVRRIPNAVSVGLSQDFGSFAAPQCPFYVPGSSTMCILTNFSTPAPLQTFQKGHLDGTPNQTSGFQQYGYDFGSFMNTWASGCMTAPGGGTNTVYNYRPSPHLAVFDGYPDTEMVLQAELEVPWVHHDAETETHAQLSLVTYLTSSVNGYFFAVLVNAYENRAVGTEPFVSHDGQSLFISTPFQDNNNIMSMNPRDGAYVLPPTPNYSTSSLWTGKRLFRAFVSRQKLANYMAAYGIPGQPEDYRVSELAVLHELFCGANQISSAMHGSNLRMWAARYH